MTQVVRSTRMVGRMRSDVVLACAWALFSSTHGVPLHFSFPLEDEVLFGNNLRIVWRYDVRCASNSHAPPMANGAEAARHHEFHFLTGTLARRRFCLTAT